MSVPECKRIKIIFEYIYTKKLGVVGLLHAGDKWIYKQHNKLALFEFLVYLSVYPSDGLVSHVYKLFSHY